MDKGSLSLLGPSVHTYWVIRPNYERKVRFPFMLLNKRRASSPSISQHQQGPGDLQIKRSHYLCPPHHHHDCCPPQHRCTRGAERVFLMIWGIKVLWGFFWRRGGWRSCPHSSVGFLVPISCDLPLVKFGHS